MPIVDHVVDSFEQFETFASVDLVITDGDDTLFPHGSPIPYADSLAYLNMLQPKQLILVSGNPNVALAEERLENIGAGSYFVPQKRPMWVKYGLFVEAVEHATWDNRYIDSAVILGNRWCMDIAVAKLALRKNGIKNSEGILLHRDTMHREMFDKIIVDPVQYIGATALKRTRLDTIVRPRRG